jgi:hypothetical protein
MIALRKKLNNVGEGYGGLKQSSAKVWEEFNKVL